MSQAIDVGFLLFLPISSHAISIRKKMIYELGVKKRLATDWTIDRLGDS